MSSRDPATWVSCAAVVGLLVATLPWRVTPEQGMHWERGWASILGVVLALVLTLVNWYAGSHWVLALSYLGHPDGAIRPQPPWSGPGISAPTGVPFAVTVAPVLLVLVTCLVRVCV